MTASFKTSVDDWVRDTKADALAVMQDAAQDFLEAVAERTPVDIGWLKGTLTARIGEPPAVVYRPAGLTSAPAFNATAAALEINKWDGIEPLYIGFGANYARYVEYGTSRMAGRHMLGLAAQQFPMFVANRIKELALRGALKEHQEKQR